MRKRQNDNEHRQTAAETILLALHPDLDLDEALDNVGYRRDGTPIWIGDDRPENTLTGLTHQPDEDTEDAPDVETADPDAPTRRAPTRRSGAGKPDISRMTHEERAKYFREVMLPASGSRILDGARR